MTDIRIVSRATLKGIFADWLVLGRGDRFVFRGGQFAWLWFGQKHFGAKYFGPAYFAPPWRKTTLVAGTQHAGSLDESGELATAVTLALLTNARASEDDILPDPDSSDRQGWWGDTEAETIWDGWPIGCKNWLLARSKITDVGASQGSTVIQAEEFTRTALQPFIDKRICSAIDVTGERIGLDRIDVSVTIFRGPREEIELRFQDLWSEIRAS